MEHKTMIKKNGILEIIELNQDRIKRFGVKKIGVFGSFAKNIQRKGSDVDILVEFFQGQKTFDHYMELKDFLEKLIQRKVDLVVKESLKPRIKPSVLKNTQYAGL
jgi:predicted nucleotidyltransferase